MSWAIPQAGGLRTIRLPPLPAIEEAAKKSSTAASTVNAETTDRRSDASGPVLLRAAEAAKGRESLLWSIEPMRSMLH
jgi:hypothetical protein